MRLNQRLNHRLNLAILTLITLTAAPIYAQTKLTEHTFNLAEGQAPAPASIEDFAWLAGRWTGEGLGGRTEEVWTPPDAGAMVGTFRLIRDEENVFYELMTIADFGEGFAMRLKHVHPDMRGWEERDKFVQFRYIGVIDGVVHFEGLAFRRESDDELTLFLALRREGAVNEHTFRMQRVSP